MLNRSLKSLLVLVFGLLNVGFFNAARAQENGHVDKDEQAPKTIEKKEKTFDANEVIFHHVLDAHEFHFLSYKDSQGQEHHANIPLPVILYSPQKGFSFFMSSAFHHGQHEVDGYKLVHGEIVPVEAGVKVY